MYRFENEPNFRATPNARREQGRGYGGRTTVRRRRAPLERTTPPSFRVLLLWLVLVASSSCGGPPSVEGTWSGTASGADGESGTLTLDIEQEGDSVTGGSGELREDEASGGQAALLSVEGGSVGDDGSVTILAVERGSDVPLKIAGEVSGDALEASLSTPGGEIPFSLERGGGTGGAEEARVPDASGRWSGTATDETGDEAGLEFSLEQDSSSLSGSGVLVVGGERVPFEPVTGSVDGAGAVELAYRRPGAPEGSSMSFSGTLNGNSLSGEATLDPGGASDRSEGTFRLSRSGTSNP